MKKLIAFSFILTQLLACTGDKSSDLPFFTTTAEKGFDESYEAVSFCESKRNQLSKAIYGDDGRMGPCQFSVQDVMLKMSANVALLVTKDQLEPVSLIGEKKIYRIKAQTYADFFKSRMGTPLCEEVPFRNEPAPGFCTAFLFNSEKTDKSQLLTARHCLKTQKLEDLRIIFTIDRDATGYLRIDEETPKELVVSEDQIFSIASVQEDETLDRLDVARVEIDGKVHARGFELERDSSQIVRGKDLMLIGHPLGLEMKIDLGGEIKRTGSSRSSTFEANIDAFHGNSGSPLINVESGKVLGVLVSGNGDFKMNWNEQCFRERTYSDSFEKEYEIGIRIDRIIDNMNL